MKRSLHLAGYLLGLIASAVLSLYSLINLADASYDIYKSRPFSLLSFGILLLGTLVALTALALNATSTLVTEKRDVFYSTMVFNGLSIFFVFNLMFSVKSTLVIVLGVFVALALVASLAMTITSTCMRCKCCKKVMPRREVSIEDRIIKLGLMKEKGQITEREFEKIKKDYMKKL